MDIKEIKEAIRQTVSDLPQRDNVKKVALFGSYIHNNAREESDIDLLIEFEHPVGYFELVRIQRAFEKNVGRKIDLVEPEALSKYFRSDVLREAKLLYAKR
jgi:uncharacterized protein